MPPTKTPRRSTPDFIPAEETAAPDFIPLAENARPSGSEITTAPDAPHSAGWLPSGFNPGHMLDNAVGNLKALAPSGFNPLHPIDNFKSNSTLEPVHGQAAPFVKDISATVGGNLGSMVAHPIKTIEGMATFGKNDPISQRLQTAKNEWAHDPGLAIAHGLGDAATGVLTDSAMRAPAAIPNAVRNVLTSSTDEPIVGAGETPRQRYAAAKRLGVNLDLADATGSSVPKALKAINEHSLFGSPAYEASKTANIAALNDATKGTLNEMSPLDRETAGYRLQGLLKDHQESLKSQAQKGFDEIESRYGSAPVANPETLSSTARRIQAEEGQHLSEFPSLKPGKVASVVDDAARFGKPPAAAAPALSGLVDESGTPILSTRQPAAPPVPKIGDALKARSGILDMYQNNPEIVKSAADAQLQRLVGAAHDTVMESLPDGAKGTLRDAQETWKQMKGDYDNPHSPFYDAVRTLDPSSKVTGIGPKDSVALRDLVGRVGTEGKGIIQRGTAEKALGTTTSGEFNFRAFPSQFGKLLQNGPYVNELYRRPAGSYTTPSGPGPEGNFLDPLRDISSTSQALSKDLNPSGTAKLGQKIGEAASLLPTGGLPILQYPLAKLINSPRIVDWAMREPPIVAPKAALTPLVMPSSSKKTGTR